MSYKKYDYKDKSKRQKPESKEEAVRHAEKRTAGNSAVRQAGAKKKAFKGIVPMVRDMIKAPSGGKMMIGVLVIILLVVVYVFGIRKNAYAVYFGDVFVGNVNYKNVTAEDISTTAAGLIKSAKGYDVAFDKVISIKHVHASYSKIIEKDQLLTLLQNQVTYKVKARELSISGVPVLVMENEAAVNEVLKSIQDDFDAEGVTYKHKTFLEQTGINVKEVAEEELISKTEAVQILKKSTAEESSYTVIQGDNPSKIAQKHGMTLDELKTLNPQYNEATPLREGDVFKVIHHKPLLNVVTISTLTYTEAIPKGEPLYQDDDTILSGIKTISQKGVDGEKEVTVEITWENGVEASRTPVDEKILKQPVQEIILVGKKARG